MIKTLIEEGCSILIPTWNNLEYLKKCVESIRKYSHFPHEIILHINEGTDGTIEWAQDEQIMFSFSKTNVGVCKAMNEAVNLATKPLIAYFNDDMVALPEWDLRLQAFADKHSLDNNVWLSSTMIEPHGSNPCCLSPFNFGTDVASFKEDELLKALPSLRKMKQNVKGSTWPPNIIHRDLWDRVGGYSEEFSPGFGSDPDLAKKLYDIGVRDFIGVSDSLVYHFVCKTTRVKNFIHNDGETQFFNKYGFTIEHFVYNVLKRGSVWNENSRRDS